MRKIALTIMLLAAIVMSGAQNDVLEKTFIKSVSSSLVLLRQDYQLVDDDSGEIKNAPDKEYLARNYYVAVRVGDDGFLISGEAVRPWSKEAFSKNDRFQPAISSTAIRSLYGTEFESVDFYADGLEEIHPNRIYMMPGSEEQGMGMIRRDGHQTGIAFWVCTDETMSGDAPAAFSFSISPIDFDLSEDKSLYDFSGNTPGNAVGGFFLTPVIVRPGLVDYCIAGMFQKISGTWRLVAVPSGTEIGLVSDIRGSGSEWFDSLTNEMERGIGGFFSEIGICQ